MFLKMYVLKDTSTFILVFKSNSFTLYNYLNLTYFEKIYCVFKGKFFLNSILFNELTN